MAKKATKPTRRARKLKATSAPKVAAGKSAAAQPVSPEPEKIEQDTLVADSPPQSAVSRRWVVGLVALAVLGVALVVAIVLSLQRAASSNDMTKSGQTSADADKLLENGGGVCTNGSTQGSAGDSTNPQSVGMMLQNVPGNTIQTPQAMSTSNTDGTTLQGAGCY